MDTADFMHTFADFRGHCADNHTESYKCATGALFCCHQWQIIFLFVGFIGPTWRQRDGSVLVASRRFDGSRSRKTKGSLADTLQCNIWRRAQSPFRMTHSLLGGGEGHLNGFAALGKSIVTPDSTDKDSA